MTDLNTLIPQARAFYTDLNANNSKAWWGENRGPYDSVLKPGAQAVLADMEPKLSKLTTVPVTSKLFRPHRDVRFSKDKTPYNTHLHMMWMPQYGAPQNPVYFFGIGLDYVSVGAGMMGFEKPVQENWRKFLDLDTDRILGILSKLNDQGASFREPELKRVPSPFAPDHAAADHLRRKGMIASLEIGTPDNLLEAISQAFEVLTPLNTLLVQIAEA